MPGPLVPSIFDLTDKVVLITGGSRGLGLEIGLAMGNQGARVVVASRKLEACEEAAAAIRKSSGAYASSVPCHVGDWEQCDQLINQVLEEEGRIDVLVNNAGMSPLYGSLPEVSEALFDKVFDINLKGPFRLAVMAAMAMQRSGGGSIINVSSTAAVEPHVDQIPYAAAKAGLNTITIGLARAFGPSVRVNAIMPGPFLTDISKSWDMQRFEKEAQLFALRRGGRPSEIAGAAVYLASEASSFTTGAVLKVDGGAAWAPG